MQEIVEDFIGIFPNAATEAYCDKVIKWFEYNNKKGVTTDRQRHEGAKKINKDSELFFFENTPNIDDIHVVSTNSKILTSFNMAVSKCYEKYREDYAILDLVGQHKMSDSVKIQKYKPSQGYHVWHCDNSSILSSRRILACMLYLNDIEEGGETEFLYQRKRIKPKQGTIVIFPTFWTHAHRGNPPLKGEKYIINSWLEFMS